MGGRSQAKKVDPSLGEEMTELVERSEREQARAAARRPKKIGDVMSQLFARKGYGRVRSSGKLEGAWREAVGDLMADQTRVGAVRRGVLQAVAANSTVVQELSFRQNEVLSKLAKLAPDAKVKQIRYRIGAID